MGRLVCLSRYRQASRPGRRVRSRWQCVGCTPSIVSASCSNTPISFPYTNALRSQSEQTLLLGILQRQTLEASEDDGIYASCLVRLPSLFVTTVSRTICYYDRILPLNGFVCDGCGEIDGKEDGVHLAADRIEGCFEQYCDMSADISTQQKCCARTAGVVETLVGQNFWVAARDQFSSSLHQSLDMDSQPAYSIDDSPGIGRRSRRRSHRAV